MVLREENLMTKIMLRDEKEIIEHIEEEKMEINLPINQVIMKIVDGRYNTSLCSL